MYQLLKDGKVIYERIKLADTMTSRMIGLMFAKSLDGNDALWIKPCNQIHTFFMKFDLDIVYMTKDLKVLKIIKGIKPYRMTWLYFRAHSVLEFTAGTLSDEIREGDKLDLVCIS